MSRPVPLPTYPGQESVWDYPRPPAVEPTGELVEVVLPSSAHFPTPHRTPLFIECPLPDAER